MYCRDLYEVKEHKPGSSSEPSLQSSILLHLALTETHCVAHEDDHQIKEYKLGRLKQWTGTDTQTDGQTETDRQRQRQTDIETGREGGWGKIEGAGERKSLGKKKEDQISLNLGTAVE